MNYVPQPSGDILPDRDDDDDRRLLLPLGDTPFPSYDRDLLLPLLGDDHRPLLEGCVDTGPFSPLDRSRLRLLPLDDRPFPRLFPISWRVSLLLPPGALVRVPLGLVPVCT